MIHEHIQVFGADLVCGCAVMSVLTLQQVADELQVSERTINRYVAQGLIPVIDVGAGTYRKLRVTRADLDAFIEARRVKGNR